mgnify:CR=1 FL=1|tara:strand:- start:326 stop:1216 length:891 start_codon:yes stop_codon:yes gene_type:complete
MFKSFLKIISKKKARKKFINKYIISDKSYAKKRYYKTFSKNLNLKSPETFNEKIQWIKLYDRNPLMNELADKYKVRNYVKEKIGEKYLNNLLGVYNSYYDFNKDLNNLPDKFIIKANHGSGWNEFIDKNSYDSKLIKEKINFWLKSNYYYKGREWNYKNIKPLIICEELIQTIPNKHSTPNDYKVFCFNGDPLFIQVDSNRFDIHNRNLYDKNWELIQVELAFPNIQKDMPPPKNLDKIIHLAKILAQGFNFVRIDFYDENKIIFGEFTFYPGNGFEKFVPQKYDEYFGQFLNIKK